MVKKFVREPPRWVSLICPPGKSDFVQKAKKKIVLVARPEVEEDRVEDPAEPFRAPLHSSSGPVTKQQRIGRELSR